MPDIFSLEHIKTALKDCNVVETVERGFIAYSQDRAVVPPVGELIFNNPPGDVHIKYGYIRGDKYYVIKIASGFYENIKLNLPSGNGLMLLFKQDTGELACILLDQGYLTDVRTAAAGAVVAKYLAPKNVHRIGILGTGIQGHMQLEYLMPVVDCRDVLVWGRNPEGLNRYKKDMEPLGFHIETTTDASDIASTCNLIVTATPAKSPMLLDGQIRKGTHITAMGSDTPEKNEVEPGLFKEADIVVADSKSQCLERGDIHHALEAGAINPKEIVELGDVIENNKLQRSSDEQITIAHLTGVAVQDIQISKAVYQALRT